METKYCPQHGYPLPCDKCGYKGESSPWLDKPDRAGWWVYQMYYKGTWTVPNLVSLREDNLDIWNEPNTKWLYIEPPEPPKE